MNNTGIQSFQTNSDHQTLVRDSSSRPPVTLSGAFVPYHEPNRRNLGNFPDIVDSDICFLPTSSEVNLMETVNQASDQAPLPSVTVTTPTTSSPQPADTSGSAASPFHGEHRRSISAIIDHQQFLEQTGANVITDPAETRTPSQSPPRQGADRVPVGSTHISTQDLNVGIVSRLNPQHEALPDLLHSHVIPSQVIAAHGHPPGHPPVPPRIDHRAYANHHGHSTSGPNRHQRHHYREGHHPRRHRRSRTRSNSQSDSEPCKESCLSCLSAVTSFRWILVVLSLLGVCCVVTGIVLAALHAAGNSFLFLAIMFIGLGVLLVVVVAVGWKCTPRGHEPLHALFGLGDFRRPSNPRERRSRRHHHRRREGQWYGGVMYPEFQYRRPPPSYNASMQEFQQQLAIAQSYRTSGQDFTPDEDYSLPSSPPPSYRSRASTVRTGIQITFPPSRADQPNSRPPTYRSHVGDGTHSRPSLPRDDEEQVQVNIEAPSSEQNNTLNPEDSSDLQHLPLGASASTSAYVGATDNSPEAAAEATSPQQNDVPSPDYQQEQEGEYPMLTQL